MWHKVKDIAARWDLDLATFEKYAADNQDNYAILMPGDDSNVDMEVNTWNVDALVKDYIMAVWSGLKNSKGIYQ